MSLFDPDLNAIVCELSEKIRERRRKGDELLEVQQRLERAQLNYDHAERLYAESCANVSKAQSDLDRYLSAIR